MAAWLPVSQRDQSSGVILFSGEEIGDAGIVEVPLGTSPGGFVATLFGTRAFVIMSKTNRDVIHSNTWVQMTPDESEARPSVEEFRFMAWIAICHGATGLLWFGSGYEIRPSPLLDDLMVVVRELSEVQPFLPVGNVARVRARVLTKKPQGNFQAVGPMAAFWTSTATRAERCRDLLNSISQSPPEECARVTAVTHSSWQAANCTCSQSL